ncbi:MAG TPA: efflux RND transporter periplasmic adaptor subunit [Sedimenticola sp.]|nr:efflux RND transporter periplasmic adaptor subunit [Sedimenticola sp.]
MRKYGTMQKRIAGGFSGARLGLTLASALLLAACGPSGDKTAVQLATPAVVVATVAQQEIPVTMELSATIKAVKQVDIIPRVSGYILERYFREGDFVHQDDPLYLIDPKPYQTRLEAARAKLEQDQASLKRWTAEAARYTRLAKQGAGSVEDKEKAIAHKAEYQAAIARDRADIEETELKLGYTRITAPLTGRIQLTRINVGQLVQEQKDVLTTIVQMDPIHAVTNVSRTESYAAQLLRRGGLGMQTLEEYRATIKLPDGSPYPKPGHLDYLSAEVDPETDAYEARALFPNRVVEGRDADLIPGQYAPLTLTIGRRPDTLLIPQRALVESQAGTHVYVVGDGNRVDHRKVAVGGAYRQQWIIEKGLKKGEKVIVEGVQKVKDGMTVKIAPRAANTAPARNGSVDENTRTNEGGAESTTDKQGASTGDAAG